MGQDCAKAVIAADIARALSPATIDTLEDDLAVSGGLAFRFLAARARGILDGGRTANPLCHNGVWAFDIDGFVLATGVPHGGKTLREAREILSSTLRRALEVAAAQEACPADGLVAPLPRAGIRNTMSVRPHISHPQRGEAQLNTNRDDAAGRVEHILSQAHYTRIPAWLLDSSLGLTVSERILLADILDVLSGGSTLSYEADRARIERRCGLGASTASCALRGLAARGVLLRAHGCRGRYALSWEALAQLARTGSAAAKTVGHARAQADIRRRLCDTRGGLAVPVWAVECCGAGEAALLLSKAWACAHAGGEGVIWASGQTLSQWLPGAERPLRRARAGLAQRGLVTLTPQHSHMRAYRSGTHSNRTAEFAIDAKAVVRTLLVRGHDFGDLNALARELFMGDASIHRDAAAWDALRIEEGRVRAAKARRRSARPLASAASSSARLADVSSPMPGIPTAKAASLPHGPNLP